ncbi:hypothetical protein FRB99_007444 [Tulasnella sp. 403]|nr:hypothetical protein FRB99_007444 [Tulasnella sp. 403]
MPSVARISYALLASSLFLVATTPSTTALSYTGPSVPRHAQHAQQLSSLKKRMIRIRQGNLVPGPNADTPVTGNGNTNQGGGAGTGTGNGAGTGTGTGTGTGNGTGNGAGAGAGTGNNNNGTGAGTGNGNGTGSGSVSAAQETPSSSSTAPTSTQQPTSSTPSPTSETPTSTTEQQTSTSPTSQAPTSTTDSAQATSPPPAQSSAPPPSQPPVQSQPTSIDLNINTDNQASPTNTGSPNSTKSFQTTVDALPTGDAQNDSSNNSANTFGRNSMIAIVVIASCVGGAAAIWTLIRKWKLGPSARFEDRMQPIEWSPDMGAGTEPGFPGVNREKDAASISGEKHKRAGSAGSHGSFHSGDVEHANVGRNVTGNGNMFADQNPSGYAPEAHDFTAGAAVPYNAYDYSQTGYVDLQRANSTSHGNGADLTRGPSIGHAAYPNEYDQAYANAAYPAPTQHDAYPPDAYGGYDAYNQHQYPEGTTEQYPSGQYPATQQGARY